MTPLEAVSKAREGRDVSKARYLQAVRAAKEAGETVTAIALAAGVSRPTLYKMLRQETK